ncbi:MAG: 2-succinyl-5-enolpyruvyl-6-hydroxy-3-cyclohexene-1-carboxylic-acid synthase [Salinivirgaceae bacterium]|nr:2-succinyl-5-enolpyruvyl-6-hydroxy-3-cyclohexene-1-carboxylic-acid synthase [Salinivirgaceae bacterium]
MYCNKTNVNILTSLLVAHGVRRAVVCPGSRNAAIVHNLNENPDIECFPVTDERSAGFFAIGIAQATGAAVAVCVTSGSALLNLAPAVAEAHYQHVPLIVVSADRPQQWIDQLDGQTLPQPGALGCFVRKTVQLPEPANADERWYCNRLVNEALIEAQQGPVHINVPITEPLFCFDVPQLPAERVIRRYFPSADVRLPDDFLNDLRHSHRPLIIVGQCSKPLNINIDEPDAPIVLHEALSVFNRTCNADEALAGATPDTLQPDLVIYVGDAIVSKRLKAFVRKAAGAKTWRVSADGNVEDTFQNLCGIIVGRPESVMPEVWRAVKACADSDAAFANGWRTTISDARTKSRAYNPDYSQVMAVKLFEQKIEQAAADCFVHYANSISVRLANIYANHFVWCNRGVNGIEGSLSTAAGFSAATDKTTFCVIGDLSFFYDQNALWNQNLKGNFRILLINNGCGAIFNQLPGLDKSAARNRFVAAEHNTTAMGICQQNNVLYLSAHNQYELAAGLDELFTLQSDRPILLEVLTSAQTDEKNFREITLNNNR